MTELRRKMRARNNQLHFEIRIRLESFQHRNKRIVIRSGECNGGDTDHSNWAKLRATELGTSRRIFRPSSFDNAAGGKPPEERRNTTSSARRILPTASARADTSVFRTTFLVLSSDSVGSLRPWPTALSISRTART